MPLRILNRVIERNHQEVARQSFISLACRSWTAGYWCHFLIDLHVHLRLDGSVLHIQSELRRECDTMRGLPRLHEQFSSAPGRHWSHISEHWFLSFYPLQRSRRSYSSFHHAIRTFPATLVPILWSSLTYSWSCLRNACVRARPVCERNGKIISHRSTAAVIRRHEDPHVPHSRLESRCI